MRLRNLLAGVFLSVSGLTGCDDCSNKNSSPLEIKIKKTWTQEDLNDMKAILDFAKDNQVVMFGEVHFKGNYHEMTRPYRDDNDFVIDMLPALKKEGYNYLALELPRNPISYDSIYVNVLAVYATGSIKHNEISPEIASTLDLYAAGWFDLIDEAKRLGMTIVNYDVYRENVSTDTEMRGFKNVKEQIFDKDPEARVIFYAGAFHVQEKPTRWIDEEVTCLGVLVDEYTKGRNFTVSFTPYQNCDFVVLLEDKRIK